MGDSERAVRKMESSFRMRNISFSVFLTCEMRHYWTYERYQLTYSKRITHAVKWWIVVREKVEFCALQYDYGLLFLHDESERKNFESNIA